MRTAIAREDNAKPKRKRTIATGNGAPQMVIKRSASPDGRIDSLSVEFSCPVDESPTEEIKARAEKILELQSEVIESFLARRPNSRAEQPPAVPRPLAAMVLTTSADDGDRGDANRFLK